MLKPPGSPSSRYADDELTITIRIGGADMRDKACIGVARSIGDRVWKIDSTVESVDDARVSCAEDDIVSCIAADVTNTGAGVASLPIRYIQNDNPIACGSGIVDDNN